MTAASLSSKPRIVQLDALRGLAVIGIVWMNVLIFAMPSQAYYNPMAWGGQSGADIAAWAASFVFVEDKFRTLFAMLFGAGCVILLDQNEAHPWRAHYARMLVLFAMGLAHALFLASNDILRAYALAGLFLPFFSLLSSRALIASAIGLVALHVGFGFAISGVGLWDWWDGRLSSQAVLFAERNFGADPASIRYMLEQGQESFGDRITRRFDGLGAQLGTVAGAIPLNLAAIVLGMALWRNGMLRAEWPIYRLQRLAAWSAIAALPVLFALAYWMAESGFPGAVVGPVSLVLSAPFDMLLSLAFAAAAMALFVPASGLVKRLATVGRLSLTNYIMTSVVLGALYASWGLGLFGTVSRVTTLATTLLPIALMLMWSPIWLKQFGQGPLERLWRWAAKALF